MELRDDLIGSESLPNQLLQRGKHTGTFWGNRPEEAGGLLQKKAGYSGFVSGIQNVPYSPDSARLREALTTTSMYFPADLLNIHWIVRSNSVACGNCVIGRSNHR